MSDRFEEYVLESLILAADAAGLEMTEREAYEVAKGLATSIENWSTACAPTPVNPALDVAKREHAASLADRDRSYAELERLYEAEKETNRRLRRQVEEMYR